MTAFDVLEGNANSRYVDRVEIRFADGAVDRPALSWVSEPIHQGFFIYRVPPEHRRPGHEIESVVGLDADGRLVVDATRPGIGGLKTVPRDAIVDKRVERARISGRLGEAVIWEAPTRYDGRCAWLELRIGVLRLLPCAEGLPLRSLRRSVRADRRRRSRRRLGRGSLCERKNRVRRRFARGDQTPGRLLARGAASQAARPRARGHDHRRPRRSRQGAAAADPGRRSIQSPPCFAALPDPSCP